MSTNCEVKEEGKNALGHYISEKQAAEILGVCRITMLHLRQRNQIGFHRVGRSIRYSIEEHIRPFLLRYDYNRKRKGAIRAE
jgi:excisionase family DNA binding protein